MEAERQGGEESHRQAFLLPIGLEAVLLVLLHLAPSCERGAWESLADNPSVRRKEERRRFEKDGEADMWLKGQGSHVTVGGDEPSLGHPKAGDPLVDAKRSVLLDGGHRDSLVLSGVAEANVNYSWPASKLLTGQKMKVVLNQMTVLMVLLMAVLLMVLMRRRASRKKRKKEERVKKGKKAKVKE